MPFDSASEKDTPPTSNTPSQKPNTPPQEPNAPTQQSTPLQSVEKDTPPMSNTKLPPTPNAPSQEPNPEPTPTTPPENLRLKYRSKSREIAMQFLYQADLCGLGVIKELSMFFVQRTFSEDMEKIPDAERTAIIQYAKMLIDGCLGFWKDLDNCIAEATPNWSIARMNVVDRNILRVGTYEILYQPEVPAIIILTDAIEIGKRFSTVESGRFINGVLNKIWKTKRPVIET